MSVASRRNSINVVRNRTLPVRGLFMSVVTGRCMSPSGKRPSFFDGGHVLDVVVAHPEGKRRYGTASRRCHVWQAYRGPRHPWNNRRRVRHLYDTRSAHPAASDSEDMIASPRTLEIEAAGHSRRAARSTSEPVLPGPRHQRPRLLHLPPARRAGRSRPAACSAVQRDARASIRSSAPTTARTRRAPTSRR